MTRSRLPLLWLFLALILCSNQQVPARLPAACGRVVLSDGNAQVELTEKEAVMTEHGAGITLVVRDSAKLRQAAALIRPTIRFCAQGVLRVAHGNPVWSSAIPPGAEAFYPLSPNNNILFQQGRVRILLVEKLLSR